MAEPADLDIVRRLARPLLYAGTAASVLGFGWWHGSQVGHYSFVSSSRFSWALAYIVLLAVSAYAVGLPDPIPVPLWLALLFAATLVTSTLFTATLVAFGIAFFEPELLTELLIHSDAVAHSHLPDLIGLGGLLQLVPLLER